MKYSTENTRRHLEKFAAQNGIISWVGTVGSFWRKGSSPHDVDVLLAVRGDKESYPLIRERVLVDLRRVIADSGIDLPVHSEAAPQDFSLDVQAAINFALVAKGATTIHGNLPEWIKDLQGKLQGME